MRTSVPGTCNCGRGGTIAPARGFTLLELLVVLVVMGLFVGLVSAIVRPDDRTRVRLEADRLAQLLELAADEARYAGKRVAWTADASGYRFWRADEDSPWLEIRDSDALRARALPAGVTVAEFRVENLQPQDSVRLEFPPQGSTLAYTVVLASGAERYAIEGSPVGDVRVVPGAGNAGGGSALP